MGVTWHSPRSQQRRPRPAARRRQSPTFRRVALYVAGLAAPSSVGRRQVELSEHAHALETLRRLHKVAAGSTHREDVPAPRGFLTPAALTSGALADAPLSLPPASAPVDRSDPRPAAAQARVAAHKAARSLP